MINACAHESWGRDFLCVSGRKHKVRVFIYVQRVLAPDVTILSFCDTGLSEGLIGMMELWWTGAGEDREGM
jgi:hypothetical protein